MSYRTETLDGTAALPSWTFANDLDTGVYRIGANNFGIAVGGAKIVDVASTGVSVTGTITSSGGATITAGGLTVSAGTTAVQALTATTGSFSSTLAVTGASTLTGDVVAGVIRRGTADASDNSLLELTGGGARDVSRGGVMLLGGNEHATVPGWVSIQAGNVAGGIIQFQTGAAERGRITDGGIFAVGTTVVGTTPAGGIVTKNAVGFYGVNTAGTDTQELVYLDANNIPQLGTATGSAGVKIPRVTAANLQAAAASRDGVLILDTTNLVLCYYINGQRFRLAGTSF
jgi:fibronectin-binding autotransporter adhesin